MSIELHYFSFQCFFFEGNNKTTRAAAGLHVFVKEETLSMELCAQCHKRWILPKDIRFLEVCEEPHLLLWAKLKGFPYWPAKLIKITDDMAQVYYFGDHERSLVPLKNCFLYSKEDPNKKINKKRMAFDRSKQVKCENAIFVNINIIKCKIVFFSRKSRCTLKKSARNLVHSIMRNTKRH